MPLRIQFVVLSVGCQLKINGDPKTIYFTVRMKNNISSIFEQSLTCEVTLKDITKASNIPEHLKLTAARYSKMPKQTSSEWLNDFIEFRNQIIALISSNNRSYVTLLAPQLN